MKKQAFPVLLAVTGIFFAFTVGLLIGRNSVAGNVQITGLRSAPIHAGKPPIVSEGTLSAPEAAVTFPIDINSATEAELTELPGIGKALAQRILAFREENGPFPSPEELLLVPGIGQAKLEAILDLITTEGDLP